MSDQKIRFGVAGLGRIGRRHAQLVHGQKGFQLTAVSDPSAEAVEQVSQEIGDTSVEYLSSYEAMLGRTDVDWVVIATPSHLHEEMTCQALTAGKHVLVEKPMAGSAAEAERMIDMAKSKGLMLTVNQTLRYQADTVAVRKLIEAGTIGDVVSIYRGQNQAKGRDDWQIWKKYGGGAVANLGSHFIDAVLYLLKAKPKSVSAYMGTLLDKGDAEDWFKIIIRCQDNQVAEAEMVAATHAKAIWHVVGTKGTIYAANDLPMLYLKTTLFDGTSQVLDIDLAAAGDKLVPFYQDLADHLCQGLVPPVDPMDVLEQMKVIDAVHESNACGRSIDLQ